MLARSSIRVATKVTSGVAVGGGCIYSFQQRQRTSNEGSPVLLSTTDDSSMLDLVVPTLEATVRAARLATTAVMIGIDYKTEDWFPSSSDTDEQAAERQHWEDETIKRRKALEEAQMTYTKESRPELEMTERIEAKRQEKESMQQAAEALTEAEEQLAQLGSRRSQVHRQAAERGRMQGGR